MPHCVTAPRRRFASALFLSIFAFWLGSLCSESQAQLPQTRLYSLSPMGAQAGESVEVTVANGADLDELDQMVFSHSGISAKHKSGKTFTVSVGRDEQSPRLCRRGIA